MEEQWMRWGKGKRDEIQFTTKVCKTLQIFIYKHTADLENVQRY